MRAKAIFDNLPHTLTKQLNLLVSETNSDYARAVSYLRNEEFAIARGHSRPQTYGELVREMHKAIRDGSNF